MILQYAHDDDVQEKIAAADAGLYALGPMLYDPYATFGVSSPSSARDDGVLHDVFPHGHMVLRGGGTRSVNYIFRSAGLCLWSHGRR